MISGRTKCQVWERKFPFGFCLKRYTLPCVHPMTVWGIQKGKNEQSYRQSKNNKGNTYIQGANGVEIHPAVVLIKLRQSGPSTVWPVDCLEVRCKSPQVFWGEMERKLILKKYIHNETIHRQLTLGQNNCFMEESTHIHKRTSKQGLWFCDVCEA